MGIRKVPYYMDNLECRWYGSVFVTVEFYSPFELIFGRKTNLILEYLCKWLTQQLMYRGECNCGYMIGQVSTNDQGYHGHLTVQ